MVAWWCAQLVGSASFHTPNRGIWRSFTTLAPHDRATRKLVGRKSSLWAALAPDPEHSLVLLVERLGLEDTTILDELTGQLARLPGWSGFARYCSEWRPADATGPSITLTELLAIRLCLEVGALEAAGLLGTGFNRLMEPPVRDLAGEVALVALERGYRRQLLAKLDGSVSSTHGVAAQVVCCIDVRSEGLRRHLEDIGPYATVGAAGFFGFPFNLTHAGAAEPYPSAPVLLNPAITLAETAEAPRTLRAPGPQRATVAASVETTTHHPAAMFPAAQVAGWWLGPLALLRSAAPSLLPPTASNHGGTLDLGVLSDEEQAAIVEGALRSMSLTDSFAPLVVVLGHGSSSVANAHGTSLDCGACGGHPGAPNARALVAAANNPAVRVLLSARGVVIPPTTLFVAGIHDTTTDVVTLFTEGDLGAHHHAVETLRQDLLTAGAANAAERSHAFSSGLDPRARSRDWAEPCPEWGLVGNASFIIGPRSMTQGVNLERRAFLHSYDPELDPSGSILETILTAPVVVAQWINAQYYFSTTDPELFGAGDKTLHNPIANVGVLEGVGGDLKVGLPRQSLFEGDVAIHTPQRLLCVIEAPEERIDAVIARNPILRQLFDGGWVHLTARTSPQERFKHRIAPTRWVDDPDLPENAAPLPATDPTNP